MSTPSEMPERHARALGQLAELGLALAADLQRRALAAEDDDTAAKLADGFHKVGRSVRQTLALEAKLLRDGARADRETADHDERTRPLRLAKRQVEVRKEVERLIWAEVENDEDAEICVEMLADLVGHGADVDDFLDHPLDVIVDRIKIQILRELTEYRADHPRWNSRAAPEPELRNSG